MRKANAKLNIAIILTVVICLFTQTFYVAASISPAPESAQTEAQSSANTQSTEPDTNTDTENNSNSEAESSGTEENSVAPPPETEIPEGEVPGAQEPSQPEEPNGDGGEETSGSDTTGTEQPRFEANMLRQLLLELAGQLGQDYTVIINWLLRDAPLEDGVLEEIHFSLIEHPELTEVFFENTKEIYNELKNENEQSVSEEDISDDDGLKDILDAAAFMEESMEENHVLLSPRSALIGAFQFDALSAIPLEETVTSDPYVPRLFKEIRATLDSSGEEIYRHYTVDLGFEISMPSAAYANADIVLLVDHSSSTIPSMHAIRSAARYFVSQPEILKSGRKISIVRFSDDANTLLPPTLISLDGGETVNPAILDSIYLLGAGDNNNTNLQAGIIEARRALGMDDKDIYDPFEDGHARAVVLLTDGAANRRETDVWRVQYDSETAQYMYVCDLQSGDEAEFGTKRWTYVYNDRVYLDGTALNSQFTDNVGANLGKSIAAMEAQFLVSQGVDLYAVGYSSDAITRDYLKTMTYSMNKTVTFGGERDEPPYSGKLSPVKDYEGERSFLASDSQAIDKLIGAMVGGNQEKQISFTLTDTLEDAFEFVPAGELDIRITDGGGNDLTGEPGWAVTAVDGLLTVVTPLLSGSETYCVTYQIRVKDDPGDPMKYYEDGDTVPVSEKSILSYTDGGGFLVEYNYTQPTADVPPLLLISVEDDEIAAFIGQTIALKGEVNRGNGAYTYKWFDTDGTAELQGGLVDLSGYAAEDTIGTGLIIPVKEYEILLEQLGEHIYYLEVIDTLAYGAGYSGGKIIIPIKILVVDGRLTVIVEGTGDNEIPGQFETTILKTDGNNVTSRFHFMGLGTKVYDMQNGLTPGTYTLAGYAPYGYKVAGFKVDGESTLLPTVVIEPLQDDDGNWVACEPTVTVVVERVQAKYFYDWAWAGA